MKRIFFLPLALALSCSLPVVTGLPEAAQAQVSDHQTVPLAVIRFNQPRVYFQRPVANAVHRAMQVSPGVQFNVIQYLPGDRSQTDRAERNLQSVLKHLSTLGVAPDRVSVRKQVMATLGHSEVHIYVR